MLKVMWNCVRCFAIFLSNMFAQLMKHTSITVTKGVVFSYLSNICQIFVNEIIIVSAYQNSLSLCRKTHGFWNKLGINADLNKSITLTRQLERFDRIGLTWLLYAGKFLDQSPCKRLVWSVCRWKWHKHKHLWCQGPAVAVQERFKLLSSQLN